MKYLTYVNLIILAIAVIFFIITPKTETKTVKHIQKEIHYIHEVRKEQTKIVDTKIKQNETTYAKKRKLLDTMSDEQVDSLFDSTFEEDSSDFKKTCLDYKFKSERDSVSLVLMTADRDSCNEQIKNVISKVDTIVVAGEQEKKKLYKKGFLHGTGVTSTILIILGVVIFI